MSVEKKALLDFSLDELRAELAAMGEKPFRAAQIYQWLQQCRPFSEMNNLPKALRERLAAQYREGYPEVETVAVSRDGTRKYLLRLADGNLIETVLMRYRYGNTLCISTQVGCPMGCVFCASGLNGIVRNMTAGEMLGEVLRVNAELGPGRNITNVVLMGTGEPLLNYKQVVKFLRLLHAEEGMHVAMRNISLSTCGITPAIDRLAAEELPVTLCLSLHSAIPEKRRHIMPVEERFPLPETIRAMRGYERKTGRRTIYEYILLSGFNMGEEDADALATLLRGQICHVNLIPLNGSVGQFQAPTEAEIERFFAMLRRRGISATRRRTLGEDIEGACGQLRARYQAETGK